MDLPHDRELHRLRCRLRLTLGALVPFTLTGVLGYLAIGHPEHGFMDAVYMPVITLTTVGYGEVIDLSTHPGGRCEIAPPGDTALVPGLTAIVISDPDGRATLAARAAGT